MSKNIARSKLIERSIMAMIYIIYGIAVNFFLLFFDGDYPSWAKIVNLIPLCLIFTMMISFFILSLKRSYNIDFIYSLGAGFGISSGISASVLAFLIAPFIGAYFSFFAITPIVLSIVEYLIWRYLNRQDDKQDCNYFHIPYKTRLLLIVFAVAIIISLVYVCIEASIRGSRYNFTVLLVALPIIVIPSIYSFKEKNPYLRHIAFLFGTIIGISGLLGCTTILNYSIMGGTGALIISICSLYICISYLIYFFITQCILTNRRTALVN